MPVCFFMSYLMSKPNTPLSIFDLTAGEVYSLTSGHWSCSVCGLVLHNVTYRAMATNRYLVDPEGTKRRFFVYHNPFCSCTEGIWLDNT